MILLILTLTVSTIALSIFIAINPLTIGLIILIIALILATTFAYAISSWIAFLIFLIYIGGMLVIFSYFVSIIPNQTLQFSHNLIFISISITCLTLLTSYLNIKPHTPSSYSLILNFIYLQHNIPSLLFLALILLFTIVVVVKLTILSKGPLRPFSAYV
jgi:NADH-ubiquinone oxidoreductase chain 6